MKKILFSFFICFGLFSNQIKAVDTRDEKGRTPLMNYIIEQEAEVAFVKADVKRLWNNCYEYVQVNDGFVTKKLSNDLSYSKSTHRKELRRRISCTDQDVQAHKQRELDLKNTIEKTVQGIRVMALSNDLYVNAIDHEGYSAQNYCYTYEFYNELREQGALFQWYVWTYFNPGYTTLAVVGVIASTSVVGSLIVSGISGN